MDCSRRVSACTDENDDLTRVLTAEDVSGCVCLPQVVQMDIMVGRPYCNLMRRGGVVLDAADIGAQLYRCGRRCLLGGPCLQTQQASGFACSVCTPLYTKCEAEIPL